MLYIYDEIIELDDNFHERMISLLSEQRREKVQNLRSDKKKNASAVAYLLLRLALKEEYGIDEIVEFDYIDNKKPVLREHPNIHFNLSHSLNTVACAVANTDIGVDVQQIDKIKDNVAKRVLTEDEFACFQHTDNPDEFFCEIWTIKESFLKLTGKGISDELRELSADSINDKKIYKGKDYYCCVCGNAAKTMTEKYIGRDDFEQLRN